MTQPSTSPIEGGRKFVNDGFGNRCVICGGYFDEGGICNAGHSQGATYYYPPETVAPKKERETTTPKQIPVVCAAYSGCRCNICHGFFADGDDICGTGGHQIGQTYFVTTG